MRIFAQHDGLRLALAPGFAELLICRRLREQPQGHLSRKGQFAIRGRLLAGVARDNFDGGTREDLVRIRTALYDAGLKAFLPPIESALVT
jgi:hypothetical protein